MGAAGAALIEPVGLLSLASFLASSAALVVADGLALSTGGGEGRLLPIAAGGWRVEFLSIGAAGNAGARARGVAGAMLIESAGLLPLASFLASAVAFSSAAALVVAGVLSLSRGGGEGRLFPIAAGCWRGLLPIGTEAEGATVVGFEGFAIGATGGRGGTADGLTAATLAESELLTSGRTTQRELPACVVRSPIFCSSTCPGANETPGEISITMRVSPGSN
jgi:hypothetical protein